MKVSSVGAIGVIAYQRMMNKAENKAANDTGPGCPARMNDTPTELVRDKYSECVKITISDEAKRMYQMTKVGE